MSFAVCGMRILERISVISCDLVTSSYPFPLLIPCPFAPLNPCPPPGRPYHGHDDCSINASIDLPKKRPVHTKHADAPAVPLCGSISWNLHPPSRSSKLLLLLAPPSPPPRSPPPQAAPALRQRPPPPPGTPLCIIFRFTRTGWCFVLTRPSSPSAPSRTFLRRRCHRHPACSRSHHHHLGPLVPKTWPRTSVEARESIGSLEH